MQQDKLKDIRQHLMEEMLRLGYKKEQCYPILMTFWKMINQGKKESELINQCFGGNSVHYERIMAWFIKFDLVKKNPPQE